MRAYKEEGEVDWVQLTAPCSVEQVKRAREAMDGPFSICRATWIRRFQTRNCWRLV